MKLVPFEKLARRLPSANGANTLHPGTLYRWHRHGVLRDGARVRLQAIKMGGRWCSSWKWLKEFWGETTGQPVDWISPAEERRHQARTTAQLQRLGYRVG